MKGSSFVRADQPRRRAREDLVRSFMRARRSAGAPVRAIARHRRKPETTGR
jgi:hypothetical protein